MGQRTSHTHRNRSLNHTPKNRGHSKPPSACPPYQPGPHQREPGQSPEKPETVKPPESGSPHARPPRQQPERIHTNPGRKPLGTIAITLSVARSPRESCCSRRSPDYDTQFHGRSRGFVRAAGPAVWRRASAGFHRSDYHRSHRVGSPELLTSTFAHGRGSRTDAAIVRAVSTGGCGQLFDMPCTLGRLAHRPPPGVTQQTHSLGAECQ